ncbi:MAG: peptidoglycan-binding protein [Kineosporiaceae bacterium]|nr:peptidoglycan-binding protein [Kineosporiaceae bacterium]
MGRHAAGRPVGAPGATSLADLGDPRRRRQAWASAIASGLTAIVLSGTLSDARAVALPGSSGTGSVAVAGQSSPAAAALPAALPAARPAARPAALPVTVRAAAAVPAPRTPSGLPRGIESLAPYVPQNSCNPVWLPGSSALGDLLRATYPGTSYSVGRDCGADGMASEHYEGRAVDWFVSVRKPDQAARATALLNWLFATDAAGNRFANARRLGIMYIIWNDRIWGSYSAEAGWRAYSTCALRTSAAADTTCHRDHIHISLSWAGAMRRTSFWTGTVAPTDYGPCAPADLNWAARYSAARPSPCPPHPTLTPPLGASPTLAALVRYGGARLAPGSSGVIVRTVQSTLGLTPDGAYGPATTAAVTAFQRARRLNVTGITDPATWRALIADRTAREKAGSSGGTGGGSGGSSGGSTKGSGGTTSTGGGTGGGGLTSSSVAALRRYAGTALRPGSSGPAVLALQQALRVPGANGYYGKATTAAVVAFQKARRLTPDGLVGPQTWKALLAG